MGNDILEERWKRVRASANEQWGKLTDNTLDRTDSTSQI
jgi:uncharacterized protein YjbJ (UPF0337 family)